MENDKGHSVDIEKWLKLNHAAAVGPITFKKLMQYFGSIDKALGASVSELTHIEGIGNKTAEQIAYTRNKFDTKTELELAEKHGVQIITIEDSRYPVMLKQIYDPPPIIYVKGTLTSQDNLAVAIVGSRRCSLYGQEQASRFAHLLSAAGFTICSGMARGIDSAAHQGALSANGRTIAVQGCGLAQIYPPENKNLFEMITKSGACISELPMLTEPTAENFPPRNRIIAGLSLITIVIEAGLNSGALITAAMAMENNREVMAVPGKIDSPLSKGAHKLIKEGAKLVESIEDIIEGLGYIGEQLKSHITDNTQKTADSIESAKTPVGSLNLTDNEKNIYKELSKEAIHLEELIAISNLSTPQIYSAIISLQLKGLVKQLPGNMFLRR